MSEHFDEQLRNALRRTDAPAGFAERVLAEAARQSEKMGNASAPEPRRWRWTAWQPSWVVAAMVTVVLVVSVAVYRSHQEREMARQRAGEEALYALRLTNEKITPARKALAQLGLRLGELSPPETERQDERP